LPSDVNDRISAAAICSLKDEFSRALPQRIGLLKLRPAEQSVARLGQGRERAPIVEVEGLRELAMPTHIFFRPSPLRGLRVVDDV
jgi:hypothetical protein